MASSTGLGTGVSSQVRNVLFATQSSSLDVFYDIAQAIRKHRDLERVAFYVSEESHFERFSEQTPDIESDSYTLLKEWEVVRDSLSHQPDMAELRRFEENLDVDSLWSVIVADRRVYGGPCNTIHQDYVQRFNHERMLSILSLSCRRMGQLFDDVKPDLVAGFICVTMGDYLSYLFAKARGIPYLNLRPTRVDNCIYAGGSMREWSESFVRKYHDKSGFTPSGEAVEQATDYLTTVQQTHARYEGIIQAAGMPPQTSRPSRRSKLSLVKRFFEMAIIDLGKFFSNDWNRHRPGMLESYWFLKIQRPMRARRIKWTFRNVYVYEKDLPNLDYAFFPLHAEPEMQINVHNSRYLNQIEAVRCVAASLPVGMKLLVKEHPWTIGRRTVGYYRKLLEIPNVRLVAPEVESRPLITHARLMAMISGSIALEAAMVGKPVVTLGTALFNILPSTMICSLPPVEELGERIRELLKSYQYEEEPLVRYFATVIDQSIPIDWYSRLLRRPESMARGESYEIRTEMSEREKQIKGVARYLLRRTDELYGVRDN